MKTYGSKNIARLYVLQFYQVKTTIGRQPGSKVWVLNPSLQIDCHGNEISPERHPFFWYVFTSSPFLALHSFQVPCLVLFIQALGLSAGSQFRHNTRACGGLSAPLHYSPDTLLEIARHCLHNNFISAVLTVVGGIISFHYESILQIQDEWPLFLCYSRESGTGRLPTCTCMCTCIQYTTGTTYIMNMHMCIHM